ncbi:MAG: nucleoside deaminase [Clostridia bacterium]|nr:nucleoside deaminase [Clostridia bacterium]MBN2882685.1 nucleoside deaminase [Clostridia bacterium]
MYEFMKEALIEANKAYLDDDVPVGAVIVKDGKVIARGYNRRNIDNNAILHAEIIAIDSACRQLGTRLLNDCDLYVTLEPCPMCAGAIIQSGIRRLYFGAYDPKAGCAGSVTDLFTLPFNSIPEYFGGIMEDDCTFLLTQYFKHKR